MSVTAEESNYLMKTSNIKAQDIGRLRNNLICLTVGSLGMAIMILLVLLYSYGSLSVIGSNTFLEKATRASNQQDL